MEFWDLYWISRLDNFKGYLEGITVTSFIILVLSCFLVFISKLIEEEQLFTYAFNALKYSIGVVLITALVNLFIPTTKQYLAFYSIDVITHEEKVIDTADKLYQVVDKILDEQLKEAK